ncbi:MAG TPA: DUF4097 family beta strand repeat-containing protein [Terriglobales bacterium]|jgi:DUF4097 and DUF4098 domain-containing protein YvlB|nr:DUF4097 family beta strand repeat-containing protein [Terriglobales bacterium]
MASPTQVPPIRHRRSLSGPIILITIGGVFLLGTMGLLNWGSLAHWFAHYWPVILIVAGIIKLIEYQAAQREGTRVSGIGAGGVFLIIMVVFLGLLATQASRFNWGELRDHMDIDDSDFTFFGQKYTYEDRLAEAFPAGSALHVNDIRGAVSVSAGDDDQIHVSVHKRINAESSSEADKWNAGTKPQISVSGGVVTLNANNQAAGDHGIATDLDITIPRKAAVTISTRNGDVSVVGRDGDVQISAQHDDVTATDINGKVSLTLERSSARISQISSDVSIEGRANDVSVEDIKGAVHLDGEFMESVKLSRLAQGVTFHSSRTDLQFFRLNGDLDLDSGDLQASDVVGPVRLSTRAKDVRLTGVAGDVRLQDENGSVELHLSKLGSVQVENRKGDVQIYVPDKAGFQVDARSRGGDVETDFDGLKVDNREDQATATGTVGSGGPHLVVTNEHGTIEIRKGSTVAEAPAVPPVPASPKAPRARPASPSAPPVTEN